MNGTTVRGGNYGFNLTDLIKTCEIKADDNKTTLLMFLI